MAKSVLKTIRFAPGELREIQQYLRGNPSFESISSLGRVSMMEFIRTRRMLSLHPLERSQRGERPSFLWDYDLTETEVQEILQHAPMDQRKWLIARILERAPLPEVFRYLTVRQIQESLPHLRIGPKIKRHWEEAVELWTTDPSRS